MMCLVQSVLGVTTSFQVTAVCARHYMLCTTRLLLSVSDIICCVRPGYCCLCQTLYAVYDQVTAVCARHYMLCTCSRTVTVTTRALFMPSAESFISKKKSYVCVRIFVCAYMNACVRVCTCVCARVRVWLSAVVK